MKNNDVNSISCPLCEHENSAKIARSKHMPRDFWRCHNCPLVYVPEDQLLTPKDEKKHYDTHENNASDMGYRKFLDRLLIPMQEQLTPINAKRGLDFGCGPGPTISVMMGERGYEMANYDPFFHDESAPLNTRYDFVTSTEVCEHVYQQREYWQQLKSLLRPQAILGIMTKLYHDEIDFSSWYYATDPTHVRFFHAKTIEWLASTFQWQSFLVNDQVIIFSQGAR
jgi:hypothetical protein